jgi:transposase
VFEVERPRRQERRKGKSDRLDAMLAAKKILTGDGLSTPRGSGKRAALQMLLVAHRSLVSERSRLYNTMQALQISAPNALRERIGHVKGGAKLAERLTGMRTRPTASLQENTTLEVLRDMANRTRALDAQAKSYALEIENLARALAPKLLEEPGVGPICAGKLLVWRQRSPRASSTIPANCNASLGDCGRCLRPPGCGSPASRSNESRCSRESLSPSSASYATRSEYTDQSCSPTPAVAPLTAAILIGQTAGAERFKSDAHFARIAGVAPVPVSSGRQDRHRLDRGGNRQLNRALRIIAITRGRLDPGTLAYLARKEAEGKSRMEAMRCLKRHLARRYYRLLSERPRQQPSLVGAGGLEDRR